MDPRKLAAVAAIIAVPVIFAAAGGSRSAGLLIGVVLVVGGVTAGLLGGRGRDDA
jgi:hypothetical protein